MMTIASCRLTLPKILRQFLRDETGATSIEYGLIVALIFLGILAGVRSVGDSTNSMYSEIQSAMENAGR